ncbi:helix-turn-helix domain-containing protein [Paenibacillus sp. 1_12]|uniref:helix-turn-helix domain-containing protein n=1 Tax=Paenibacillus sp. 1_12 TaxID=1566278 RepID=UPI003528C12B
MHVQKILKAKELLSRTTMSVIEIAKAVGLHDEKYFMRLFKNNEKMTPTKFRNAYYLTHLNNK